MPDECSRVENNCGGGFSINAAVNQPLRFPGSVQTCKQNSSSRRRTGAGGLEVLVQHAVKCHIHPALHLRAGWIWHFTELAAVRFNCRMKALWSAAVLLSSPTSRQHHTQCLWRAAVRSVFQEWSYGRKHHPAADWERAHVTQATWCEEHHTCCM